MVIAYLGIGSNLGDRRYYIQSALKKIRMLSQTRLTKVSRVIETAAVGGPSQGPYLNAAMEIETGLSPYQLLRELQKIETDLGRVRLLKDGPRTIDLDILTYGDFRINEEALCIPHPRLLQRDFVLHPLSEIALPLVKKLKKSAGPKLKKRPAKTKKKKA
jgi:2-amino-4-hydroxy-6-hydroxymethyldihydropteridine diphosphokinase